MGEEYRALAAPAEGAGPTVVAADAPAPAAPAVAPGGDRIGPYRVLRELGRGGMGVVVLAEDTRLPRKVALKVLPAHFASSRSLLARFQREAALAARLDHPHICTIYEAGEADGTPYLSMRLVEGTTLAERIERSRGEGRRVACLEEGAPLPSAKAPSGERARERERLLHLFEKAARALHHAHEKGLLHRDVKPHNVMVTPEGEPVLLDFGLAREQAGEEHGLTQTGTLLGTPAYMSPEQLLAARVPLDRRTDVYSLGVSLYEAFTLRLPFEAGSVEALYQRILSTEPEDPGRINRDLPRDLRVVIATAMEKDRERRFATALDLAEDLRRIREGEPILARPPGLAYRASRWARRRRGPLAAMAATAAAVAGLSALLASGALGQTPDEVVAMARDLEAKGQSAAARMLYEKGLEKWGLPFESTVDAPPPSIAALYEGSARCLLADAAAAGTAGRYEEARLLLLRARGAVARTTPPGRAPPMADLLETEERWCRLMTLAVRRDRAAIEDPARDSFAGAREHLAKRLADPAHPEFAAAAYVAAVAASHPRNETVDEWLRAEERVHGAAVAEILRQSRGFEDREFGRCAACLRRAVGPLALRRGAEVARAVAALAGDGTTPGRERAEAAAILAQTADLPPGLPAEAAPSGADRVEVYRSLLGLAASQDPPRDAPADRWLRAHTGLDRPAAGWAAWWETARQRDPRDVLEQALALDGDPAARDPDRLHALLLRATDRFAARHHLLALRLPPGAGAPAWVPDPAELPDARPPPEFWTAWTRLRGDRFPARRVRLTHLVLCDWAAAPEAAWDRTFELRPGTPARQAGEAPTRLPPGPPVRAMGQDMFADLERVGRFLGPHDAGGRYVFGADLLLDARPAGATLSWSAVDLPGWFAHQGTATAAEGSFLVRETWGTSDSGAGEVSMAELVVAGLETEGSPSPADPVAACRARGLRLLASLGADPSAADRLEDVHAAVTVALLLPLPEAQADLRAISDRLRAAGDRLAGAGVLGERLAVRLLLARLLAGDAAVVAELEGRTFDGSALVDKPDPAPTPRSPYRSNLGWSGNLRLGQVLVRLLDSPDPAVRRFAGSRLSGVPLLSEHGASRVEAATRAGEIEFPFDPEWRKWARIRRLFLGWSGAAASLVLALWGLAIVLALRPGALPRARLRPAVVLLGASLVLPMIRVEGRTWIAPTSGLGLLGGAAGAWVIAMAGSGRARWVTPVGLTVFGGMALVVSVSEAARFGLGPATGIGAVLAFIAAIAGLPGLGAGLAEAREGPTPGRRPWNHPHARQVLALLGAALLTGGVGWAFGRTEFATSLGAALGLLAWILWALHVLWRDAGRSAGAPSAPVRLWRRLRGRS